MSLERRLNKYALALGATWGTAPTFGANDGFYPLTISGTTLTRDNTSNKAAGMGLVQDSHQGPDHPVEPGFQVLPFEDDVIALLVMAAIMGADTVTGAADPYTHTMEFQNTSDYFVGLGYDEGDDVKLVPSAIVTALEVSVDTSGRIVFDFKLKGATIDDGGGTELDSVTYKSRDGEFTFPNMTLRINGQSGAGLAAGDEIQVTDFKLRLERPCDDVVPSGESKIIQPKQGDFPNMTLEFTIPRKNTAAETLYTAFKAETLQKADIVFSGTTADRELKIEMPQVKLTMVDNPHDEIITTKVQAELQKAAAAPTGMTTLVPVAIWKTDEATSPLV